MDLQTAFDQGFDTLKAYVDRSFDTYAERIDVLEQRLANLPVPKDGKSADEDAIVARVVEKMAADIAEIRKAVEDIPDVPELPDVAGQIEEALVSEAVEKAVAALPVPQDGKSVTIDDVKPLVAEAVDAIPKPKDGVNIAGGMIDRDGNLILTLSNGEAKNLGRVVGKDIDPAHVADLVAKAVDAIPKPKDGLNGVGFDDMDMVETDDGIFLRFVRGENVKDFRLPVIIDRGVYVADRKYFKGDFVTWGGCGYIAQEETDDKPGTGKGWRMAVKKGRDGKDVPK